MSNTVQSTFSFIVMNIKVLHVGTKDTGGAAVAGIRLHRGLLQQGIESKFLFQEKKTTEIEESYYWKPRGSSLKQQLIDKFTLHQTVQQKNSKRLRDIPKNYDMFSFPDSEADITQSPLYQEADVINLHWVPRFLDYASFFRNCKKPLVWTLHDMNPFSGGFHYQRDLVRNKGRIIHLDQQIRIKKKEAFSQSKQLTLVAPSYWMYEKANNSELLSGFSIQHIPYGLDTSIFKLHNQAFARRVFNLPKDKKILLFVSDVLSNERKGLDLLLEAISAIEDDSLWLCAVGNTKEENSSLRNVSYLGRVNDERLIALVYSACDAFVLPSREDNMPNVKLESIACGVPVIAFPVGGIPDVIQSGNNGVLADEVSSASLYNSIKRFLDSNYHFSREEIRKDTIENYSFEVQAKRYIRLYNDIAENIPQ